MGIIGRRLSQIASEAGLCRDRIPPKSHRFSGRMKYYIENDDSYIKGVGGKIS